MYHLKKNGDPGKCRAKTSESCPLNSEHYSTMEAARRATEKKNSEDYVGLISIDSMGRMLPLSHLRKFPKDFGKVAYFSDKAFDKKLIAPIENRHWNKPNGGLWVSPLLEDNVSEWSKWTQEEAFSYNSVSDAFIQEINFHEDSKVLMIDSREDFNKIIEIYGIDNAPYGISSKVFDFEKMSKDWDVVWLTDSGQWETRYDEDDRIAGPNLYGWDLESMLVLNKNCIISAGEQVVPKKFKSYLEEDDQFNSTEDSDFSFKEYLRNLPKNSNN